MTSGDHSFPGPPAGDKTEPDQPRQTRQTSDTMRDDWSFAAHATSGLGGGFACGYHPLLTAGRLVHKHDPAWQMAEKTRDPGCLTELVRVRAVKTPTDRRPGYALGFFHSHRSQREYPGYPDFHIWSDYGAIIREAKRMGESPSPDQSATLTRMHRAGLNVGVWWPCCWYAGWIDAELAQLAQKKMIEQHWAPGLPPQPGQPGYVPWTPDPTPPTAAPPASSTSTRTSRTRRDRAGQLAPTAAAPGPQPPAELPGAAVPPGFPAEGCPAYVIPMPATARASDAGVRLDEWLRAHGFPTTAVPYPARIVDGAAGVAVQCRAGGLGSPRTWRWAPKLSTLPSALLSALDADIVYGAAAAAMLDETDPATDQPTT